MTESSALKEKRKNKSKMKKIIILLILFFVIPTTASAVDIAKRNDYFKKGMEAYQEEDYDKAVEYYEQVVDIDSNFAPVYNALGLTYSSMGSKLSDVIWFFKVAVDIDPDYTEAYNNMCRVYYNDGRYEKSEEACLRAVSTNPDFTKAKLSLAWIYLRGKKDPYEAIYYFNEVLEKVKNPRVYFGLGIAYAMSGDRARVIEMITLLREMNEDDLASQLEASIRDEYIPPVISQMLVDENVPGEIIGSPSKQFEPERSISSAVGSGQMRIRLKGRLENLPRTSSPVKHPGSL